MSPKIRLWVYRSEARTPKPLVASNFGEQMSTDVEKDPKNIAWPLLTAGLALGLGIAAFFWLRSRSGEKPAAVDDLLHICENFADTLEQSLSDNGQSAIAS